MKPSETIAYIAAGGLDATLAALYGQQALQSARKRYTGIIEEFIQLYGDTRELSLFSAPGRTEIGGNHTDHNNGRVVAAAVNLDIVAAVAPYSEGVIRFASQGFPADTVDITQLAPKAQETESSAALIRGVAARFAELGMPVGGFVAYSQSEVLKGSGLSSSAAFEVLLCNILNGLYGTQRLDAVEAAKISRYAENVYFGKPCGLMDQVASSVGGFVAIDFADTTAPIVTPIALDFAAEGYSLCITDTGSSHDDITDCYAAIKTEMSAIAGHFGKTVLRQCSKQQLLENAAALRAKFGDRAWLRAYHFFCDDARTARQAQALQQGNLEEFFALVRQSGLSSVGYLQNIYDLRSPAQQGVMLALALSEEFLGPQGAFRIHGGGFAGTVQAFVPTERAQEYADNMERVFGTGSCYLLQIRRQGGTRIL